MQNESSVELNEVEAEGLSAFTEAMKDTRAVSLVVGSGGQIAVGRVVAKHTVDDDCELASVPVEEALGWILALLEQS